MFLHQLKKQNKTLSISLGRLQQRLSGGGDVKTANDEDVQSMRFVSNVVELLFGHVSQSIATS